MLRKHHCIIVIIINSLGILANGQGWPIKLIEEGESAVIPCIPEGQATSFFWKRERHNVSSDIAYNVDGIAGPESEKFHVFRNGSLLLQNMTVMDEGIYYCRIASDHSECHGSVTVYLKATNTNNLPYIDRCSPNKGCIIYEKPSSTISLTCNAHQVSSDMTLKWFNDSKQITDDVKESKNENDMNGTIISSSIKVRYDVPHSLTCQASSIKMETAFAHVQLQSETVNKAPVGFIVVTVVLGAICAVLLGYLIYAFVKQNQDKKTKYDLERTDGEKGLLLKQPEELHDELKRVKEELVEERSRTKEIDNVTAELHNLKETLSAEQKHKQDVEKELSTEKGKRVTEDKIKKELEEKLQSSEMKRQELEREKFQQDAISLQGKGETKDLKETIDKFMAELKERDNKLQKAGVDLRSMSEKFQSCNGELQTTKLEVTSLGRKLQSKEEEFKLLQEELKKAKEEKGTEKANVEDIDKKLKLGEEELKKAKEELKLGEEELKKAKEELKAEKEKVTQTEKKWKESEEELKEAREEQKESLRSHEIFQRQLRSKMLEGKGNCTIFCRIKTATRSKDAIITRKDETSLKGAGGEYKYSFIFPENATREDIFSRLEDLVQCAIDGGKATIIVHGNSSKSNSYVLYGSGNEFDGGIVSRTIRKIFQVSNEWVKLGYEGEINATFAKIFPGDSSHFSFITVDGKPKKDKNYIFSNDDEEAKGVSESIASEETAIFFLKKYTEEQTDQGGERLVTNDFIQFFITTKFQSEVISTGTLTFVLYNDSEALKDCFKRHNKTLLFPRYFSFIINDAGSKIGILSNIDGDDKDRAKEHLKFSEWIFKEKYSFWKGLRKIVKSE